MSIMSEDHKNPKVVAVLTSVWSITKDLVREEGV